MPMSGRSLHGQADAACDACMEANALFQEHRAWKHVVTPRGDGQEEASLFPYPDLSPLGQGVVKPGPEDAGAAAERMAASVERIASSRWRETAMMIGVIALVGIAVAGIPTLPAILETLQR